MKIKQNLIRRNVSLFLIYFFYIIIIVIIIIIIILFIYLFFLKLNSTLDTFTDKKPSRKVLP